MKSIKIGSGAGYSDDRLEPALDIIRDGDVDYIVFECLAERTIAIAQQRKMKDSKQGYDSLLEYRMAQVLPLCVENNVKIVTNMGAANPKAAAEMVKQIAEKQGLHHLKIAAVTGDDVFPKIERYQNETLLENGKQIKELGSSIVSANAYIGAAGIVQALKAGADIVITGRAADPSLFLGPMMYEFGWSFKNAELLGKGTIGGHLMECGAQITGGYFADPGYKEVPELWNVGFPIMEVTENGEYHITKLANAGGLVSLATVKEQLLYEIHDPANYLTPDVIADFSSVQVEEVAKDVVKVFGGSGKLKTGLLKRVSDTKMVILPRQKLATAVQAQLKEPSWPKPLCKKDWRLKILNPLKYAMILLDSTLCMLMRLLICKKHLKRGFVLLQEPRMRQSLMLLYEKQCHFTPMGQQAAVVFAQISKR